MRAMGSGEHAGRAAAQFLKDASDIMPDKEDVRLKKLHARDPIKRKSGLHPDKVCNHLQQIIFPYTVSIRKSEPALKKALSEVEHTRDNDLPSLYAKDPHQLIKVHEVENMILVAEMFLRASLERKETRSDHYREDYPEMNNGRWLRWINIAKAPGGKMRLFSEQIPVESYPFKPEIKKEG